MKKIISIIFLLIFALSIASCGCDRYVSQYDENYVYDGKSLIGVWQEKELNEQSYQTYEFFGDGRVICTTYSFGIKMQNRDETYSIDGNNTIVINWNDGLVDRNKFSITKKNVLVICQVLDSKTLEMELVPYNLSYNKSNSDLVGSWRSTDDKNEVFSFNADYTGKASGAIDEYDFHYSLKGSSLFISNELIEGVKNPVETVSYKIEGDTLTLSGDISDKETVVLTFERIK